MILSLQNISMNYGSELVLSNINQNVDANDKIGLIGINGSGKSTLLKIIMGKLVAESGSIHKASALSIGYLTQNLDLTQSNTIHQEALTSMTDIINMESELENLLSRLGSEKDEQTLKELSIKHHKLMEQFEAEGGYYYKNMVTSTLNGVGFNSSYINKKISELSGGQKMRVALVKMLLTKPDLILLDEPTNYLDMKSIAWLEGYLQNYPKAYIVVSHDRYFLEKTVNKIWEIEQSELTSYKGNYSSFVEQKEANEYAMQRAYKKQNAYIQKQREVIKTLRRFNREKSIKRAESREKQLDKMDVVQKKQADKTARISFSMQNVISKNALKLTDLTIGYGENIIVKDINIHIRTGEKIAIVADNAQGKTTLLKTICGEIPIINGHIELGAGAVITHFRQLHDDINMDNTLLEELAYYSGEDNLVVRNVLASLLFTNEEVHKKIGVLSGGELGRVAVAKLMLTKANILLLDEPTNHLDIASKEVFEQALESYEGTVLVVSHDRYLLNKLSQRVLYLDDGIANVYNCNYQKASELFIGSQVNINEKTQRVKVEDEKTTNELSKNAKRQYELRLEKVELRLAKIEELKEEAEEKINEPDFYLLREKANEYLLYYRSLGDEYEKLEEEWLEISELLNK